MKLMKVSVRSVHNNRVAADSLDISAVTPSLLTAAEHDRELSSSRVGADRKATSWFLLSLVLVILV